MRTGGVEPPQREATGLQPAELAVAQRPRGAGWPAGLEPAPTGLTTPGASVYTTATMKRGRPDSNRRPQTNGAGGIRTHGLELMRLAGTAAPLPRVARSRAHKTDLAGRSRTCDLRFPK